MRLFKLGFCLSLFGGGLAVASAQEGVSPYSAEVPIEDAFPLFGVIDAHTHFGVIANFNMPVDLLTDSMEEYGIVRALVSDIGAIEYDGSAKLIPPADAYNQMQVARRTLAAVQASKGKLVGLLWIRPHTETVTKELRDFLKANRKVVVGLKFHPWHSQIAIDDPKLEPWLALARELALPMLVHTADDPNSQVTHLVAAAKSHPQVQFVAGHMNLGGDKSESLAAVRDLPNVYGDTAGFYSEDDLVRVVKEAGASKLLFGSDAPIAGFDTYASGYRTWDAVRTRLSADELDAVLHGNAVSLFGLKP